MRKILTIILQALVVLIGVATLAFLLWEPHLEGRNAHATLYQIYFNDPFLAYAYIASISFFVVLYKTFKVLSYAKQGKFFSPQTARAMRVIKYSTISMIGFAVIGEIFIMLGESDDRAGGFFMGAIVILGSIMTITAAKIFEHILMRKPPTNSRP